MNKKYAREPFTLFPYPDDTNQRRTFILTFTERLLRFLFRLGLKAQAEIKRPDVSDYSYRRLNSE